MGIDLRMRPQVFGFDFGTYRRSSSSRIWHGWWFSDSRPERFLNNAISIHSSAWISTAEVFVKARSGSWNDLTLTWWRSIGHKFNENDWSDSCVREIDIMILFKFSTVHRLIRTKREKYIFGTKRGRNRVRVHSRITFRTDCGCLNQLCVAVYKFELWVLVQYIFDIFYLLFWVRIFLLFSPIWSQCLFFLLSFCFSSLFHLNSKMFYWMQRMPCTC